MEQPTWRRCTAFAPTATARARPCAPACGDRTGYRVLQEPMILNTEYRIHSYYSTGTRYHLKRAISGSNVVKRVDLGLYFEFALMSVSTRFRGTDLEA